MNKLSVGLVVGLIIVGGLWLRARDARIVAEALAEVLADSMETVSAQADTAYREMDSMYAKTLIEIQDSLYVKDLQLTSVRARRFVDSVRVTVTDTVILSVIDTLIAEADACGDALGTCQEALSIWDTRMKSCNYAVGVCREQRQKYADMYMESVAANRPNLFKRLEISLPFMAAAVLLTLVVR